MDAMEVFADYLEEAALSKQQLGAVVDPMDRRSVGIDMVIAVVMDVLAQYDQVRLDDVRCSADTMLISHFV